MSEMIKLKGLIKKIIIVFLLVYTVVTFFNQQKILNTYAVNKNEVENKLREAKKENEQLMQTKDNVNSNEYIEKVAREKLDMYLPTDRVYVNQEQ